MSLIIPNTFATRTDDLHLSELDSNFTYLATQLDPYVNNISVNSSGVVSIGAGINANVTGNLTGNSTGLHTGNVVGNVTGNLTGAVTLSSNSTLNSGVRLSSPDVGSIYAPGMIIQTVYKRVDSKDVVSFATAGSLGSFITSLDTTFTPKFSNSLIHIQMCLTYEVNHDTVFKLYRDSTALGINANDANYWSGTWLPGYDADNASTPVTNHFFYMDSPGTTSTITYRLMIQSAGVGASNFCLNRSLNSAGQSSYEVAISQVIIQEIKQ